jgi:hypothetical protein
LISQAEADDSQHGQRLAARCLLSMSAPLGRQLRAVAGSVGDIVRHDRVAPCIHGCANIVADHGGAASGRGHGMRIRID